jgi:peroxiredoxin
MRYNNSIKITTIKIKYKEKQKKEIYNRTTLLTANNKGSEKKISLQFRNRASARLKNTVFMKDYNTGKRNKTYSALFFRNTLLLLVLPFAVLLFVTGCRNDVITISGTIEGARQGEYLLLRKVKPGVLQPVDSVAPDRAGNFRFHTSSKWPVFYMLSMGDSDFLTLLADPGEKIEVRAMRDSISSPSVVKGSEGTPVMIDFRKDHLAVLKQLQQLTQVYNDSILSPRLPLLMDSLDRRATTIVADFREKARALVDENCSSMVAIYLLNQQVVPGMQLFDASKEPGIFYRVDSVLYDKYPESDLVVDLRTFVASLRNSVSVSNVAGTIPAVGSILPEIALPDPAGDTLNLSSTRGRIVLVDFWAAWCPPCREENLNLVSLYDQYHNRGFDIFQVSLDLRKEEWTEAIRKDRLGRWHNVSDLKYRDSEVVKKFGLTEIPANFLLDREGRVIAINIRGEELQKKLGELLSGQ